MSSTSRPYTADDIAYLRDNVNTPLWQQARHLGRTVEALRSKRTKIGIQQPKSVTSANVSEAARRSWEHGNRRIKLKTQKTIRRSVNCLDCQKAYADPSRGCAKFAHKKEIPGWKVVIRPDKNGGYPIVCECPEYARDERRLCSDA